MSLERARLQPCRNGIYKSAGFSPCGADLGGSRGLQAHEYWLAIKMALAADLSLWHTRLPSLRNT